MAKIRPADVLIVVDVWGRDEYYTHPGPIVAKKAEIFEAVGRECIREVVLFRDGGGRLVGIFVPERDAIVSLSVLGSKDGGEPRRVIPAPPPGKRIHWVEIHEDGVRMKDGPLPLPPYMRDKGLYAKLIPPDGRKEPDLHVAPPGTVVIMLGRAVRLMPGGEILPVPPEIKKVESEIDEEKGVAYINLYDHSGRLVHRFPYRLDAAKGRFGFRVVQAVLGVDLKHGLFVVTPVPDGYDVRLGVANVSQIDGDKYKFEDSTPAPPEGKKWVKIVITPEGVNLAAG